MLKKDTGFTLVEMVLIISVLGILVTIGAFAWTGIRAWSENKARYTELNQWVSAFDLYKTKYASYPDMPVSSADGTNVYYYCLGDFPATNSNRCGEYTSGNTAKYRESKGPDANGQIAADIRTQLALVGNVPTNAAAPTAQLVIGPYVDFDKSTSGPTVTITAKFIGIFEGSTCPTGTVQETSPPMGGSISGTIACKITRQLTYNP